MLQNVVDYFIYSFLNLPKESHFSGSINFFIYETIKITFLLFLMITIMGFLRTYLPQKKIKKWLGQKKGLSYFFAAIFGTLTPFCSCSSIPIFLGFLEAGVPLGITFTFLITSPLVNEYLVVLMIGFFGVKIAVLYVVSGILIGVISGLILGKLNLEKYITPGIISSKEILDDEKTYKKIKDRIYFGIGEAWSIVRKIWKWILVGVGVGAFIHGYVPEEAIHKIISKAGIFSVPIAVFLGIPMYGSCAAIVPIAVVLFQKGVPLGTALAFMMAIAALSLPEAIILKRVMKWKLIALFFGVTTIAIIFTGYLFNLL